MSGSSPPGPSESFLGFLPDNKTSLRSEGERDFTAGGLAAFSVIVVHAEEFLASTDCHQHLSLQVVQIQVKCFKQYSILVTVLNYSLTVG